MKITRAFQRLIYSSFNQIIMSNDQSNEILPEILGADASHLSRRKFFGLMGGAAAMITVASACKKNNGGMHNSGIDLGSGDVGVLNYAYALEQLEAAFYTQVINSPYSQMSSMEMAYLKDVRDHEIAHREFFKAALGAAAIPGLEVDFRKINFNSRDSVLGTAKAFEDLGVSAYNGAGKLLVSADYLTIAGKIVSVEARHAALIRDLIEPGTFADMSAVDSNGLDVVRTPNQVLTIAGTFLKSKLNASNLPTS